MIVRKIVGRGLIGMGLLLMLIGTASVPSTSWAAVVGEKRCEGACDHCGRAHSQGNGTWLCYRTDKDDKHIEGTCDKGGADCELCLGGCKKILIDNEPACTCEKLTATADEPVEAP